ncbi:MAG: hypothetical protein JWM27_2611 [Gemmatimonadetes bacterium]|nr:hypothetical protein [Gemmatimonadota bacterium]
MPIVLPANPPAVRLRAGSPLWRVHRRDHGPVWFGPDRSQAPRGRFAAPAHEFGVCYFAATAQTAVLETVIRSADRLVPRTALEARSASKLSAAADLRLLRLEGPGLPRLRIAAERTHGDDYAECQRLALDLFRRGPEWDGIQYRSRWDNSQLCWAVFDRAADKVGGVRETRWLGDLDVIGPMLDACEIAIF